MLILKYMVNLEILLSHAANDLNDSGHPPLYHNYTGLLLPKHTDGSEF